MPCSGNPELTCGGGWRNSVYAVPDTWPQPVELFDGYLLAGEMLSTKRSSTWVGDAWNDRISSIRLPRPWKIRLYEHDNFRGEVVELVPSPDAPFTVYDNLWWYGMDNRVSSFMILIND